MTLEEKREILRQRIIKQYDPYRPLGLVMEECERQALWWNDHANEKTVDESL